MSLTIEQLMAPRYKVIADYPSNYYFSVGAIITLDKIFGGFYPMHEFQDCQGTHTYMEDFFLKYPHLFKPLQWYEERDEEHLPDFVKNKSGEVFMRHMSHYKGGKALIENLWIDQHFEYLETLFPATAEEYKSQKQP